MMRLACLAFVSTLACGDASLGGNEDGGSSVDAPAAADGAPNSDSSGEVDSGAPGPVSWDPADFANVYEVGPGQPYADPSEVPWESLGPSTLVRIHWRATPYATKWVINTEATADAPLVVTGVPDAGRLPVISGDGATTRLALNYWNEDRSVVKVGGSNLPSDSLVPSHIFIESLEIQSAHPAYGFTDEAGNAGTYRTNAAAIHIEVGDHITIRGCKLSDAGNGLFTGLGSSNVLVSGNFIVDNGIEGSIYEHNSYTESLGITFEYNHYGPLRTGCLGNNLKDRSAGTVIRYNWIESGNRQLDLVDSDDAGFLADPSYRSTFVYGNVLVEPDGAGNSQVIHYGGDSGDTSIYRKGTLYLYANTIVSTRTGNTTLMRLSSNGESADVRNNIVVATAGSGRLAIVDGAGTAQLANNWLQQGWVATHGTLTGTVDDQDTLVGTDPGFTNLASADFTLAAGSPCIDTAGPLASAALPVTHQYVPHQSGATRPDPADPDLGALEH